MQLIKEKYKTIGKDVNIKIPLGSKSNLNGLQDTINNYIIKETETSINNIIGGEKYRFTRDTDEKIFTFRYFNENFDDDDDTPYVAELGFVGFTQLDINNKSNTLTNSFYILQIYDSMNSENQTLIHNSYYNGTSITGLTSSYNIKSSDEFSNFYIPEWFINDNNDNGIIEVYAKFSFFNAKTGKLILFNNTIKGNNTTEEKLYFNVLLDLNSKSYKFEQDNYIIYNNIILSEIINSDYTSIINESLSIFNNELPEFPNGKRFNGDGTYVNID